MSKSKVTMSSNDISDKWNRRMKGAVTDIQAGVNRVTENPAEKAILKKDKMLSNLTKAVNDGKWEAGLRNTTLSDWKSKTANKVGQRLASGVDEAMPKRQKFDNYLVSTLNEILPQVQNMPDMTFEDSVNKVRAVMEHMHNNPYKK